jgi:hypothetical protein
MIGRLIERIIGPVTDLASEFITDADKRAEFEYRLRTALLAHEGNLVNASRDVVVAEANSESWLARNWRPLAMLLFVAILANNYILIPWLQAFGVERVAVLDMPDAFFTLLTIGIGGYVVGRTMEKTGSSISLGGRNSGKSE